MQIKKANLGFLLMIIILFITKGSKAQTDTCRVLLDKISNEYKGSCLNGLADGNGKAIGAEDVYVGEFKDGWPDGIGTYTFKNGNVYEGFWKRGKKEGKGKFSYKINGKKQVMTGYWKNDEYVGPAKPTTTDVSYRVTSSSGIFNYTIDENLKVDENENEILFSIKSAFTDYLPSDLKVENSSGQFFQNGKKFGIRNHFYPLQCEISYTILAGDARKQCRFIIEILKKGKYNVKINND
ncbi:hypothetical protein NF867_04095 [Solitalea sp. MAHUQ-68]|uniref:MORN repeat protein n=1 Tax=Solitalea agri TaxID=2953739 RepID=A0A9X2F0K7_9SPHI|nr:hypothetical protein [Solitalea agri]MCO4292041.1 hypothetical protein [Solitalea agri]